MYAQPFKFFCSKKDISMRNKCERSKLRQNISVNLQNISVICLQLLLVSKKDSEVIFHSRASAREARQRSTMGKKNCGYPPSRENLDMTSAYERPYVRTDSGGGGRASRDIPHGHPYHTGNYGFLFRKVRKTTNDRRG